MNYVLYENRIKMFKTSGDHSETLKSINNFQSFILINKINIIIKEFLIFTFQDASLIVK